MNRSKPGLPVHHQLPEFTQTHLWLDQLVFCDYGFSVSALWCPLATPTILLRFLLPWTWGISSWLLHQSLAAAPYLGGRVSPHLECEVKWALESITTNKASGGDGIPVELFQILKDDAVKVLHSIFQHIWKNHPWPQDWKRSVFIPNPKKAMPKNAQTTTQLHSSHTLVK